MNTPVDETALGIPCLILWRQNGIGGKGGGREEESSGGATRSTRPSFTTLQ